MLGSQALEALIGVALTMSIVSLAASTIVEMIAGTFKWRAKMLEDTLGHLLGGASGSPPRSALGSTAVVRTLAGPKRRFPSYLSSAAFLDAVTELTQTDGVPEGVSERLRPAANRGETPERLRATLERHFDEVMERLSGAYKRRTMVALFAVGLFIAVIANVSVYHVGRSLWSDTPTRQAVVEAAKNVNRDGIDASDLKSVADTVSQMQQVGLPVGWTEEAKADWGKPRSFPLSRLGMIAGWLITGALVTLGAPFWFDLLSRLVALRSSGRKPGEPAVTGGDSAPAVAAPADGNTDSNGLIQRALGLNG